MTDWLTDPALDEVWSRMGDRLERNGLMAEGRLRVAFSDRASRHAVSSLLGRAVTRDVVVIDLAELDARLRARSGRGGLVEVVTDRVGHVLRDRTAERQARAAGREEPLRLAMDLFDQPWVEGWSAGWVALWVAGLRRDGVLARSPDAVTVVRRAATVMEELLGSSGRGSVTSRVEMGARLVGDAHALDEDRLLNRVVVRAMLAASGRPPPQTVEDRWRLWEAFGVSPDAVSSTCVTLGLRVRGETGVAARLDLAAEGGDPVHLTRWDLRKVECFLDPGRPVLVCENPRVLEALAESAAGVPMVCTAGEPGAVVMAVLDALRGAGATMRYHGDFDWAGIAIANRVAARCGAAPWLMTADDYERHVRPDGPPLHGTPTEPTWDPDLGASMREAGRSLHEETMLPTLTYALR